MYPDGWSGILLALGLVNTIWLLGLSIIVWKNNLFIKKLFPNKQGDFNNRLDVVLKEVANLENFKKQSLGFIQRISLKRYNPYKDTGGDQSFSAALLDGKGNGIVVTSLHSRSATRVFAKPVSLGKENKFQFSEEEQEVVDQAMSGQDT